MSGEIMRLQEQGNPFVAVPLRDAAVSNNPLRVFLKLEALRRLWVLLIRSLIDTEPPETVYLAFFDLDRTITILQSAGIDVTRLMALSEKEEVKSAFEQASLAFQLLDTEEFFSDDYSDLEQTTEQAIIDVANLEDGIGWSVMLVGSDPLIKYEGAGNWYVVDHKIEGEATRLLKLDGNIIEIGPQSKGSLHKPLLPTAVQGIFEDPEGHLYDSEGIQLKSKSPLTSESAAGKIAALSGLSVERIIETAMQRDFLELAVEATIWKVLTDLNMDFLEFIGNYPEICEHDFMTYLYEDRIKPFIDAALEEAKIKEDFPSVMKILLIKQSVTPYLDDKIEALGALANLYGEQLKDKEGLFYTSLKLFEIDPDTKEGLKELLDQARETGKLQELAEYLMALEGERIKQDKRGILLTKAALIYEELGDMDMAVNAAKMAIQSGLSDLSTLLELCGLLNRLDQISLLEECLRKRLEIARTPGELVTSRLELGNYFKDRLGNREKAIQEYFKAIELDPSNPQVFEVLKTELLKAGRVTEVVDLYVKNLSGCMDPIRRIELLKGYAELTRNILKDRALSIGILKEVLALDPEDMESAVKLVELYIEDNDMEEAASLAWMVAKATGKVDYLLKVVDSVEPLRAVWLLNSLPEKDSIILQKLAKVLLEAGFAYDAAKLWEDMALQKEDNRAEYYVKCGECYEKELQVLQKALECYQEALKIETSEGLVSKIAEIYKQLKDYNGLYLFLHDHITVVNDPKEKAIMLRWMGEIASKEMQDIDTAVDYLDKALELNPLDYEAGTLLYDLYMKSGNVEKALALAEAMRDVAFKSGNEEEAAKFTFLAGKAALQIKDMERAVRYLESLNPQNIEDPDVLLTLAKVYLKSSKEEKAKDVLNRLLKMKDKLKGAIRIEALRILGEAYYAEGRFDIALNLFMEAHRLLPSDRELLKLALDAAVKSGDHYISEDLMDDVIRMTPDENEKFDLIIRLGDLYVEDQKYEEAARTYKKALEVRPNSKVALHRLLKVYVETNRYDETAKVLQELSKIEEDGNKKASYHKTAGMLALEHLGSPKEALKHFQEALSFNPDDSELIELIEKILREQKDYEGLVNFLNRQIQVFKDMLETEKQLEFLIKLRDLYEKELNNPIKAAQIQEKILEIEGKDPDKLMWIAAKYARNPSTLPKAFEKYLEVLKLDPTKKEVYIALRDLYKTSGNTHGYWNMCGVLKVLGLANDEDIKYYDTHKKAGLKLTKDYLSERDISRLLASDDEDPEILELLEVLWPALREVLVWQQPSQVGIGREHIVDVKSIGPFETIYRVVVKLLGIKGPRVYKVPRFVGIMKAPFNPPALVIGEETYKQLRGKELRFVLGKYLSMFSSKRMPLGVVDVPTLRMAITGITKVCFPDFVIPPEIKAAEKIVEPLRLSIGLTELDRIKNILTRFRREHKKIDIAAQLASMEATANHIGLFLADDIEVAVRWLKGEEGKISPMSPQDQIVELTRYACSPRYAEVRRTFLKT